VAQIELDALLSRSSGGGADRAEVKQIASLEGDLRVHGSRRWRQPCAADPGTTRELKQVGHHMRSMEADGMGHGMMGTGRRERRGLAATGPAPHPLSHGRRSRRPAESQAEARTSLRVVPLASSADCLRCFMVSLGGRRRDTQRGGADMSAVGADRDRWLGVGVCGWPGEAQAPRSPTRTRFPRGARRDRRRDSSIRGLAFLPDSRCCHGTARAAPTGG